MSAWNILFFWYFMFPNRVVMELMRYYTQFMLWKQHLCFGSNTIFGKHTRAVYLHSWIYQWTTASIKLVSIESEVQSNLTPAFYVSVMKIWFHSLSWKSDFADSWKSSFADSHENLVFLTLMKIWFCWLSRKSGFAGSWKSGAFVSEPWSSLEQLQEPSSDEEFFDAQGRSE